MGKTKPKHDWRAYPEPVMRRGGCKVSWNYYRTEEEAKACAEAAKHNADIQETLGYDFGYCCPGSITPMGAEAWGGKYAGLFEVCLP